MKIFVTGGTGFIGSHVVRRLVEAGHRVTCLVRITSNTSVLTGLNLELARGDVTDAESIRSAIRGHDCLINLANIYSFWEPDPRVFRRVNVDGTRKVMEAALEAGIPKVVHVSTVGIFGNASDVPLTEDSEPGPKRYSEYFRTKYEGDRIVWELHRTRQLPVVVVYPAAVLGAGDTKTTGEYIRAIMDRTLPALVEKDSVFTFVHVKNVVEVIYRAMMKEGNIGEKYIAGKFRYTFGEVSDMVSEISGAKLPRLSLPDWMARSDAWLMTRIADAIKRPPAWGLALDKIRVMKAGFQAEGSKVERELGIEYTPIREALEEAIASYREEASAGR